VERGIKLITASAFESLTGKGVTGKVDGHKVSLGNRALIQELGIETDELATKAEGLRADGQTVMFVIVDGQAGGLISVGDPIKESTPEAIRQLHAEGIRIVMLTGDSETTARAGRSLTILKARLRVETMGHRPTRRRTSSNTCSPGTDCT